MRGGTRRAKNEKVWGGEMGKTIHVKCVGRGGIMMEVMKS